MALSKETVEYVAGLARIKLQPNELDVEHISPTSHILPIKNVLREDEPRESLPTYKTLENAPAREGDFFSVPKIIE
jgi:aspartyl-tRNA(Asn)/glutamyl-tRNA(Gln) amidotransferase subunit C